jgi:hypothetical protein
MTRTIAAVARIGRMGSIAVVTEEPYKLLARVDPMTDKNTAYKSPTTPAARVTFPTEG